MSVYDREVLIDVITHHQTVPGPAPYAFSCLCGWGTRPEHLGQRHAAHVADVYEDAVNAW